MPPAKTPVQRLSETATAFALLESNASKQTVTNAYLDYRQALYDAMIGDIDPVRYDVSWNMVKRFADAEIAAIQQLPEGSAEYAKALDHLQLLIKESHTYVPWG